MKTMNTTDLKCSKCGLLDDLNDLCPICETAVCIDCQITCVTCEAEVHQDCARLYDTTNSIDDFQCHRCKDNEEVIFPLIRDRLNRIIERSTYAQAKPYPYGIRRAYDDLRDAIDLIEQEFPMMETGE